MEETEKLNISKNLEYKYFSINTSTENWENFASTCTYRIPDQYGGFNCTYFEDTIGKCDIHYCPLLREKAREELEREEEFYNCVVHMEVMV